MSAIVIVALFLLSGLLVGMINGRPAPLFPTGPVSAPGTSTSPPVLTAVPGGSLHVTPAVQHLTGEFFENNSHYANLPLNETPCQSGFRNTTYVYVFPPYTEYINDTNFGLNCYAGAQSPTTLSLGGNHIGVGYSVLSNVSKVGCSNSPDLETSQIGFQLSSDAGENFAAPVWIGNTTCAYLNDLEPSFTLSTNGNIYGTFVEANAGNATNTSMPFEYANRTTDALAFTSSSTGGTSFTASKTLALAGIGNIARPVIGASGNSIYIVYENISNSSLALPTIYPYPAPHPIAVEAIESTDGGVTWHGPYILPGLNATAGWNAASPSIAVNSLGEIAVAYATNRSCFNGFPGFCNEYGEDIVASTSTTNGTSWSAPVLVDKNSTGEYQCGGFNNDTLPAEWYYCYAYLFQWEPSTSVAWSDVNPNNLYVTWAGGYSFYNASDFFTFYASSGVFAAASNDGGASWNDSIVRETVNPGFLQAFFYAPTVGVRNGWVYDSYAESNNTYCFPACAPGTVGSTFWLSTSTDGTTWLQNVTLLVSNPTVYVYNAYTGYTESMGFTSGGPVVTFSDPLSYTETFYGFGTFNQSGYTYWFNDTEFINTTGFAALTTAFVWDGNTTTVNFTETGLPAGTRWNFSLGSADFSTTAKTVEVTNVPTGPGLAITVPYIPYAFWSRYFGTPSSGSTPVFAGPTNVTIAFASEFGITITFSPTTSPFWDLYFTFNGQYYENYNFGCGPGCMFVDPAFPWYFPNGTVMHIAPNEYQSAWPISAWTGQGNGSSTNYGNSTTFTVNGVINETALAGAYGSYNVTFVPEGLPAGTPYDFTFNGTSYTNTSPNQVTIPGIVTGSYAVSGIQAPGSGGYEYFGQVPGGDEIYVPATPVVDLNFSYAYVDLSAAAGVVTFQAGGLAPGDPWQMSLNGTTYSSTTPWINITTRPGTFAVSANPIEAALNDTAQYTPTGFGPTQVVATGSTYPVSYSPTYRVDALASNGGSVTGAGSHWLAPGAAASYTAHADANYAFLGWTGTGPGSYTGPSETANITVNGPIVETASFVALPANRFNLTFTAAGLGTGIWWTVNVNGVGYSSSSSTIVVGSLYPCSAGSSGTYAIGVPLSYKNGTSGIRYVPSGYPTSACTTGATQLTVTFTEQFLVTPISTGGGTARVQINGVPYSSPAWVNAGSTAGIEASPTAGFAFSGWAGEGAGNYTGVQPNDEITPTGPVTEVASFSLIVIPPAPTYSVDFHASSNLPAGTSWTLTFNSTQYSSSSSWINVSGLEVKDYTLAVPTTYSSDHLTEFTPTTATTTVDVIANISDQVVDFSTSYFVSIQTTPGGTVASPGGAFVGLGKTVVLNATPSVGYMLVGWNGTGTGSYSGPLGLTSVVVAGPVTEVASFAPIPAASTSSNGLGSNADAIIVGLAVVGLVVGVAVGYVVFRRRSTPPETADSSGGSP
ncbi:MAG: hypothetical protein L3K02_03105 [Thermoplasmata archaeon]|nr:hypothetical protein [Thermoplasmata archaeon]